MVSIDKLVPIWLEQTGQIKLEEVPLVIASCAVYQEIFKGNGDAAKHLTRLLVRLCGLGAAAPRNQDNPGMMN